MVPPVGPRSPLLQNSTDSRSSMYGVLLLSAVCVVLRHDNISVLALIESKIHPTFMTLYDVLCLR